LQGSFCISIRRGNMTALGGLGKAISPALGG
jgi:hypothetical protein